MENIAQYMFANAYSSVAPSMNLASAVCTVNGQPTDCGPIGAALGVGLGIFMLIVLAIVLLIVVSQWKVYKKAGQPGWAAIIPIYNMVVLLQIVKKPIWWIILMFIPIVNIVMSVIVYYELAKAFGKGVGFTIGLIVLPFIFYPILAFGKSTYMMPMSPIGDGMQMPPVPPTPPTTPVSPQM